MSGDEWFNQQVVFQAELWRWLVVLGGLVLLLALAFGICLAVLRWQEAEARLNWSRNHRRLWDDTEYGVAPTEYERVWMDRFEAELAGVTR